MTPQENKNTETITLETMKQMNMSKAESSAEEGSSSSSDSWDNDNTTETGPSTDLACNNDAACDGKAEVIKIIEKETRAVRMWRCMVAITILSTAIVVTLLTYWLLKREQEQDFVNGFQVVAAKMEDNLQFNMRIIFQSMEGFSEEASELAENSNVQWPFVTIPDFSEECEFMEELAGFAAIWIAPLVTIDHAAAWRNYSLNRIGVSLNPDIYNFDTSNNTITKAHGQGPFAPVWQIHPPPKHSIGDFRLPYNFDVLSDGSHARLLLAVNEMQEAVISEIMATPAITYALGLPSYEEQPMSLISQPVFLKDHDDDEDEGGENIDADDDEADRISDVEAPFQKDDEGDRTLQEDDNNEPQIVGVIEALINWRYYFANVMTHDPHSVHCVVRNTCGQLATFLVEGRNATFEGYGGQFDEQYLPYKFTFPVTSYREEMAGSCSYFVDMYPTQALHEEYETNKPTFIAVAVAAIFFFMAGTFFVYDSFVQRRNNKIMRTAVRTNVIVSSMFPSMIRDRLFADEKTTGQEKSMSIGQPLSSKSHLTNFLNEGEHDHQNTMGSKPIADLFPETTIMFADIAGFTAWSSTREPSQVFTLLESFYQSFDLLAKYYRIFKVETVGDCYVAVSGLPEARKDHAIAMARFAHECIRKVQDLTKKLEVELGPDTTDLTIRVGLHSGPVTAGVLRGERSRFQLFGDTMNTASRMESTGQGGRIQISQDTAELLFSAGKKHWLEERPDKVYAKGKGELQTYWLTMRKARSGGEQSMADITSEIPSSQDEHNECHVLNDNEMDEAARLLSDKTTRLIDWNLELLLRNLKLVVAHRKAVQQLSSQQLSPFAEGTTQFFDSTEKPMEQVKEIIHLPQFDSRVANAQENPDDVVLSSDVVDQMRSYVTNIAAMYRDNPFHNFEHASHVTMSVTKLLSRIIAPANVPEGQAGQGMAASFRSSLHDHTYGITSDPTTQFACIFSALIHDVGHLGVPNAQLVKERSQLAAVYQNKSVLEQNSIELAFSLLMDEAYADLREAIFSTASEYNHFHQLVVNIVMATDIMDKDLKTLRNARWEKAFSSDALVDDNPMDCLNRKATIVIEHLIQASDIAHTMQHWHIYRKWNTRFFEECYHAYLHGRMEKDPSETWYNGEMGFFDFYIIPLARKLKDCGVFGVSSDEYLIYALKNRKEWEAKGQMIVEEMTEKIKKELEK